MTPERVLALGSTFAAYLREFEDCFVQDRTRETPAHLLPGACSTTCPERASSPSPWPRAPPSARCKSSCATTPGTTSARRERLEQRLARRWPAADDLGLSSASSTKPARPRKAPRLPASNASGAAPPASWTTASSPSTWASPAASSRPCSTPTCSCPRPGAKTGALLGGRPPRHGRSPNRPKWRIALEQLDRSRANGLPLDWLTFDEGYGGKPAFLAELDARPGLFYVGEVPRNFRCLTQRPKGRPPRGGRKRKRVDNLRATVRP